METPKIGLALGCGGWRGLSHVGVIKYLIKKNIPIDYICGSSVGSIIGGLYAATNDINEVEKIANSLLFRKILRYSFEKKTPKVPILSTKFKNYFRKIIGDIKIEDLKTPYTALTCDLLTGKPTIIGNGDLVSAMLASSAIPLIFGPVKVSGRYYFDGGMIHPVPTQFVRQMGAKIVIGVSLYGGVFPVKTRLNKIKAVKISRFFYLKQMADIDLQSADIAINLKIPRENYKFLSTSTNPQKLIDYGFNSTKTIFSHQKILI